MIKKLEGRIYTESQTQLFIEAPYRNQKMLQSLLSTLRPATRLCVAAGITTEQEYIHTSTVAEWKRRQLPSLDDVPAIFLIAR